MRQIIKSEYLKIKQFMLILSVLSVVLFTSCTEELASPPDVKVFVDNVEVTEVTAAGGATVNYRFEISAYATIADLRLVIFDVLSPTVKTPKQTIVAGLTNKLNEEVRGTLVARDDAEVMLIVTDIEGNEVAKSFFLSVQ
tara:strand:+ start:17920 stop:18339 length:420 start_codon:yes stop_codon:yes gene_type:complete